MVDLQIRNSLEEAISRLKGFGVLLSSNVVRDALPEPEASGLEYIFMDIVERIDAISVALDRNK